MPKILTESINALAELTRLGWKTEHAGGDEHKCKCPFHNDNSPSCHVNLTKNVFKCHVSDCGASGDIVKLLAKIGKVSRNEMIEELSTRYDLKAVRAINPQTIEKYHKEIWSHTEFLAELHKRGIGENLIRKARIGVSQGRITIPVRNSNGQITNVRRYLPGAPGAKKMQNTRGYGGKDLYQADQMHHGTIMICGGELKALIAGHFLEKHNIGAVAVTAGEGSWDKELTPKFKGKHVFICFDVDEAGKIASLKVAGQVFAVAESVHIVRLPLDTEKYPKGDINDWVGMEGATDQDLLKVINECDPWFPPEVEEKELEEVEASLASSSSAEHLGKRVTTKGVAVAVDTTPYLVPKEVGISCTRDQDGCFQCPVYAKQPDSDNGFVKLTVKATAEGMLDVLESPKRMRDNAVKEALKIPACKVASVHPYSFYPVIDARFSPQLEIGNTDSQNVLQQAFVVDAEVEANTNYSLSGRLYPSPKNQQAILLFDRCEQSQDSLSQFDPDPEELEELRVFQGDDIDSKIREIYDDLSANVTNIYQRQRLHLAVDLCFHSVLNFDFDNRTHNGWSNVLVVGDSSQGKTETSSSLMNHYGLGERVDCKVTSSAGLQGGLISHGGRWFVQWGVIPMHDRRLVVMEELKGMNTEEIGQLTDMRSSGVAQITKIEKRKANARTRLLMLSNPRSGRTADQYNFGVEVIKELMGGLEDVRRLDLAIMVSAKEISSKQMNDISTHRPEVDHKFTADLCRRLVLWAWTLTPDQIHIEDEAKKQILSWSAKLCDKYTESLPLVDRGTMRLKLARLSVALAARLFSCDDNFELVLKASHVDFIAKYIDETYSSAVMGYAEFSRAQDHIHKLISPETVKRQLINTKHPIDLVQNLLYTNEISPIDIAVWCEVEKDIANKILSFLVRKHALIRHKRSYHKSAGFIELLKELLASGDLKSRKTTNEKEKF